MKIEITQQEYEMLRDIIQKYEIETTKKQIEKQEEDIKFKESFKKGDYITYIGGSTSKYLTVNNRYRLTCSPFRKAKRVCIINDNNQRMSLWSDMFEF